MQIKFVTFFVAFFLSILTNIIAYSMLLVSAFFFNYVVRNLKDFKGNLILWKKWDLKIKVFLDIFFKLKCYLEHSQYFL